ncbi:hypothetical protein [Streptococcus ruminantium]|uniref:Uncharacterized protein n=1 Tax=Streptococcus ruminantium TaxID=1917441 RepID=A0A2Z5U4K4_9STRE|nr:hypothetical protein [Streptococcus ruminantium]MDQ8759411.1 hypothetical protein [Streptococcus ruminantium]MDQ8775327.1 hypothetical protein [Streptococcus ruminantium]MDQ8793536.1 hypothetical protein [Streptococcus ruminantium]BBA92968.1 hypothetical protein SR187_6820 [Streptococcus ruminantium]
MTDALFYLFFIGILLCLAGYFIPKSRVLKFIFYLAGSLLVVFPFALLIYLTYILL